MVVERDVTLHIEDGEMSGAVSDGQKLSVRTPNERSRLALLGGRARSPKLKHKIHKLVSIVVGSIMG